MAEPQESAAPDASLPPWMEPLFWDCDFSSLSWEEDESWIIGRILASGGWKANRWLRGRVGDQRLAEWLRKRSGAGISPRRLRFWQLVLDLPEDEVDRWLQAPERRTWDRRTKR